MAGTEVLAERASSDQHEADLKAHTADMADERGSGQDYTNARVELRKGTYASWRVHVCHDRSGHPRGKRVCGAAIGRHGSFQSVVAAVSLYYVFCKRSLHRYHEKEELHIWEQGRHGIRAPCILYKRYQLHSHTASCQAVFFVTMGNALLVMPKALQRPYEKELLVWC